MEFNTVLRALRKRKNLSQENLANEVGMSGLKSDHGCGACISRCIMCGWRCLAEVAESSDEAGEIDGACPSKELTN